LLSINKEKCYDLSLFCKPHIYSCVENAPIVRKVLNIDKRYRVFANLGIGYQDEEPLPKKVKSSKEAILKVV
jgi:hypothetical protein